MLLRAIFKIVILTFICVSTAYSSRPFYRGPEIRSIVISPKDSNIIYAGTGAGVFKSIDGGKSWVFSNVKNGNLAIDPLHPDTLYAGGKEGVYKSTDAGHSWKAINKGLTVSECSSENKPYTPVVSIIAVNPKDPKTIIANATTCNYSPNNYLFLSNDSGDHWSSVYSGKYVYALAFEPRQPKTVFATTDNGLLKSTDGGMTWQLSNPPLLYENKPVGFRNLQVFNLKKQILYAYAIGLMKSEDGGVSWQKINQNTHKINCKRDTCSPVITGVTDEVSRLLRLRGEIEKEGSCGNFAVAPSAPNILYANCGVKSDSSIDLSNFMKSTDYGKSWKQVGKGLPEAWFAPALAVDPNNPKVVFASWANGGLYRSMDGGETWKESDQGLLDKHESLLRYLQQPPLHKAVMDQNIESVLTLLKQKADVNEVSETGMTPLLWAARMGTAEIFELLRKHGAKINVKDADGHTPIHLAVFGNNIAIIQSLLKAGADINEPVLDGKNTPLTLSLSRPPIMNLLLENGADLKNPLVMQRAVESKELSIVKLLYEKGAVLSYEAGGSNLVDLAASRCQPDIVKFLLKKGLKPIYHIKFEQYGSCDNSTKEVLKK